MKIEKEPDLIAVTLSAVFSSTVKKCAPQGLICRSSNQASKL